MWPEERTAALRKAWAAGKSAGVIAKQLGCSRNSVTGKLNRMGFMGRGRTSSITRRSEAAAMTWADPDIRARRCAAMKRAWPGRRLHHLAAPNRFYISNFEPT